jgi:hypothetical protein
VVTRRGSNSPSPWSTYTTRRLPESSTADRGTVSAGPSWTGTETSTNIPGRSTNPGLRASSRTLRVRVAESNSGRTSVTTASRSSVNAAWLIMAFAPGFRNCSSVSKESARIHTTLRSATV